MRLTHKTPVIAGIAVVLALFAAVMAGCGSSATTTTTAASGSTETTAAATTTSGAAGTTTSAAASTTTVAKTYKIGITQIVTHPALDATVKGFIDALAAAGYVEGKNVTFDKQNAEGDMANATTIAQKFVGDHDDLILSVATPARPRSRPPRPSRSSSPRSPIRWRRAW